MDTWVASLMDVLFIEGPRGLVLTTVLVDGGGGQSRDGGVTDV